MLLSPPWLEWQGALWTSDGINKGLRALWTCDRMLPSLLALSWEHHKPMWTPDNIHEGLSAPWTCGRVLLLLMRPECPQHTT